MEKNKLYVPEDLKEDKINEKTFDYLIIRAINNRCFIEAISLIHNVIEVYLKFRLIHHRLKTNYPPHLEKDINYGVFMKAYEDSHVSKKIKILEKNYKSNFLKYLEDYNEMCYMFNLIEEDMYKDIIKFNKGRNNVMHKLLKIKEKDGKRIFKKYSEIIETAKLGRRIQLELSPLNHSKKDIEKLMDIFSLEVEDSHDPFVRNSGLPINPP